MNHQGGTYDGDQPDCTLLATNGDIQAVDAGIAGSQNMHTNLKFT